MPVGCESAMAPAIRAGSRVGCSKLVDCYTARTTIPSAGEYPRAMKLDCACGTLAIATMLEDAFLEGQPRRNKRLKNPVGVFGRPDRFSELIMAAFRYKALSQRRPRCQRHD